MASSIEKVFLFLLKYDSRKIMLCFLPLIGPADVCFHWPIEAGNQAGIGQVKATNIAVSCSAVQCSVMHFNAVQYGGMWRGMGNFILHSKLTDILKYFCYLFSRLDRDLSYIQILMSFYLSPDIPSSALCPDVKGQVSRHVFGKFLRQVPRLVPRCV